MNNTDLANKPNGAVTRPPESLAERYGLSDSQMELVRTQVAPGAPDDVLELYFVRCRQMGFDPLSKMLFAIPRGAWKKDATGNLVYQNGKKVWDTRASWTFQTSIDGFRAIGESSVGYAGQDGPYWCGEDGQWTDVWLQSKAPRAAKVGIRRAGFEAPLYAVATLDEYAQRDKDGALTGLWPKMPATMLAKCAEALAWRKAFPQRLAGVYTRDEMQQAENPNLDGNADQLNAGKAAKGGKAKPAAQTALPAPNDTAQAAEIAEIVAGMRDTPTEPAGEPPTEKAILDRYTALTGSDPDAPTITAFLKHHGIDLSAKPKVDRKVILTLEERRKAATALDALEVRLHAREQLTPPEVQEAEFREEPAPPPTPAEAPVAPVEQQYRREGDAPPAVGALFEQAAADKDLTLDDPCPDCGVGPGKLCHFWCPQAADEIEAWPEGGRPEQPNGDLSRTQSARIALMCKDLGISDDSRHEILWYYFEPKWSIRHLSKAEASQVIDDLRLYGDHKKADAAPTA